MLNLEKLMEQYQARSPITMERQILDRYSYPDVILLATFMRNDLERAERENLAEVNRRKCYWDAMEQIKQERDTLAAKLQKAEAGKEQYAVLLEEEIEALEVVAETLKERLQEAESDRDTERDTARHHQDRIEKYWSKRVKELEAKVHD